MAAMLARSARFMLASIQQVRLKPVKKKIHVSDR
jgi:hypothetical protein